MKIFTNGVKNAEDFETVAEKLMDVGGMIADDGVTEEDRIMAVKVLSIFVSTGAQIGKVKHILTGVGIGTAGTLLTVGGIKYFKKRKKVKVSVSDLCDVLEPVLEHQKSELEDND